MTTPSLRRRPTNCDLCRGRSPGLRVVLPELPSRPAKEQWGSTRPCSSRLRLQWRGPRRHMHRLPWSERTRVRSRRNRVGCERTARIVSRQKAEGRRKTVGEILLPSAFCLLPFYGLRLNFSYSSVCLVSSAMSSPPMKRRLTLVTISSGSPSVTMTFAIFPTSSDPTRSATPKICAG